MSFQPKVPTPVYIDLLILLALARGMVVDVLIILIGRGDYFSNNMTTLIFDCLSIIKRNTVSMPLPMYVSMGLFTKDEPVLRKETLSLNKLNSERTLNKQMIVSGWLIDTCQFLIRLPQDKFSWGRTELRELLADTKISRIALEALIGKLAHAAYIIPLSRNFLSRFRDLLTSMKEKKIEHPVKISKEEVEDVLLWDIFLKQARKGTITTLNTLQQQSNRNQTEEKGNKKIILPHVSVHV